MKKFVSMMLSALLLLSLAACGDKNNASGDKPAAPTSALNILETVWNTYGEDEKFAVAGGNFMTVDSCRNPVSADFLDIGNSSAVDMFSVCLLQTLAYRV